ncbi:MAG: redoxin domain-containing protein [Salibacteraceae bacterium]
MNRLFLFLLMAATVAACGNKGGGEVPPGATTISGKLAASANQMMMLEELTTGAPVALDTAELGSDGSYSFQVMVEQTGFYRLNVSNQNYVPLILSPKEVITVNIDDKRQFVIQGSEESQRLQELSKIVAPMDSIQLELQAAQQTGDQNRYFTAMAQYSVTNARISGQIKTFIESVPASLASVAALSRLNPDEFFPIYDQVSQASFEKYPNSPYVKNLKNQVDGMRALAGGSSAPEISLPKMDGEPLALSSLKGKVVLVDFWASWCKPCRKENPNVVRLYNQYREQGFEVYSVSLDGMPQQSDGKGAWEKAIIDDQLAWPSHVSDLKGWQSSVVPLYGVKSIPLTFLIDRDGTIIGKNLRGPSLETKLAEIFES